MREESKEGEEREIREDGPGGEDIDSEGIRGKLMNGKEREGKENENE